MTETTSTTGWKALTLTSISSWTASESQINNNPLRNLRPEVVIGTIRIRPATRCDCALAGPLPTAGVEYWRRPAAPRCSQQTRCPTADAKPRFLVRRLPPWGVSVISGRPHIRHRRKESVDMSISDRLNFDLSEIPL